MTLAAPASLAPPVRADRQDAVLLLTLDRAQSRNALSESMIAALHAALDAAAADRAVRAVVLAAEGPAFCAGHDLKELTARRSDGDGGKAFFAQVMKACAAMMQAVVACPKPIVAAVNGIATAAGCQLVASCDLAVAAQTARFATPGVDIGLFCSTPMVALTRNVPRKAAMEMLLTGEPIPADTALALGLVNRVTPAGEELPAAMALAKAIAAKPARVIALGKAAFYKQHALPLDEAYRYAAQVMVDNMMLDEAQEGIGAFLGKRPPQWPQ